MPNILDHQSAESTKIALVSDSGAGKTGSILSLVSAGYNVRAIDLDNGLDLCANILRAGDSRYVKDSASRLSYVTLTEKRTFNKNISRWIPQANVWNEFVTLMSTGKFGEDKSLDFGPLHTWGTQDVFFLDSFSFLARAALNFVLAMNTRLGQQPQLQDFNVAQNLLEDTLSLLFSNHIKCNVVVSFHIQIITKAGMDKDYAEGLGKALAPKIPRYFNNVVMLRKTGTGAQEKRTIHTKSVPGSTLELKTSNPLVVKPEYPQDLGLASLFADLRRKV